MTPTPALPHNLQLLEDQQRSGSPLPVEESTFEAIGEDRYRMVVPGVTIEADYLRRERRQLQAEVLVRCNLPGAKTYSGVLSIGDLNLSSTRSRSTHAKYLAQRARTKDKDLDWVGLLEEFAQRVLAAERDGQPVVLLHELPRPAPDQNLNVDGLRLPAEHPAIIFGDGGTTKSYLALHIAATLAERGKRVGLFDWELSGGDHRDRLERLTGPDMPVIYYARCSRPLVHEADRLRRIVRDEGLDYAIFDSIAFACDGPPEAAEVAGRYFQAQRRLGTIGSLHIAHITKAFETADQKPFGSAFWHNGARTTWNIKRADPVPGDNAVNVALHNRKANLGPLQPSVGFEFRFDEDQTDVRRVNVADVPDLAAGLSISRRVWSCVRSGPLSRDEIAGQLDEVKPETLRRVLNRALKGGKLVRFPGPEERIGLPYGGTP